MLRLVGGTDIKDTSRESAAISHESAVATVATTAPSKAQDKRRKSTAVATPSPKILTMRKEPTAAEVERLSPQAQQNLARKLVLSHIEEGKSVQTLINECNRGVLNMEPTIFESMAMSSGALRILSGIGICPTAGGRSWGLDNEVFATVVDKKLLLKRIPLLKKLTIELDGLPLY